jgi:uncharacterized damage-inducible protein DinB
MSEVRRFIDPEPGFEGEVAIWIATLEDARRQTKAAVAELTEAQLAWKPPGGGNSIGQLLRHIALVELDWVITDLCGEKELPPGTPALLALDGPMAEPGPRPPAEFIAALDWCRSLTRERLKRFPKGEIEATRTYRGEGVIKVFNVRWILYHLLDHEAQHKGQILAVARMMGAKVDA